MLQDINGGQERVSNSEIETIQRGIELAASKEGRAELLTIMESARAMGSEISKDLKILGDEFHGFLDLSWRSMNGILEAAMDIGKAQKEALKKHLIKVICDVEGCVVLK